MAQKRLAGGFWRRFWALCADLLLILSIYQIVGIMLYQNSNGHLRMSSAPIDFYACNTQPGAVGPNEARSGLRADQTKICTHYFFGFEYNRLKTITEVVKNTQNGGVNVTQTRFETYYIDRDGRRVDDVIDIDGLKVLVCLIVLGLLEGTIGTTPGKWLARLKVVGLGGRQAGLGPALMRNGLLYGGWTLSGLTNLFGQFGIVTPGAAGIVLAVVIIVWMLAPILAFLFARPDPFYDVWAGTSVERMSTPEAKRF